MFTSKKDIITISKRTTAFFHNKKQISSANIKIYYCDNSNPMLGIRISKKAVPLAVSRNSLRRRLRETFRLQQTNSSPCAVLLSISNKIQAEKKDINDILLREWKSLLNQLQ